MSKAKFGFCIPAWTGAGPWDHHLDYKLIKNAVIQSERLGYDSLWIPDHVMLGHNNENYEAWTLMSALSQKEKAQLYASIKKLGLLAADKLRSTRA